MALENQKPTLRKAREVLDLPMVDPMSEDDLETLIALYTVRSTGGAHTSLWGDVLVKVKDLSSSLEAMSAVMALAPNLACGEGPLSLLGGDVRGMALAPTSPAKSGRRPRA